MRRGVMQRAMRSSATPVCGNIAVSVCLIVSNKALVKLFDFPFMMTLTLCHMCFSATAMRVGSSLGLFTPKRVPMGTIALFAVSGVGSVAFMNLSLQHNSVGLYQLGKLLCLPTTVLIEVWMWNKRYSWQVLTSLCVLLFGVGGATITDLELNSLGLAFGFMSILFTTWYQLWVGELQSGLRLTQFQLLHAVTPYWILMQLCVALVADVWLRDPGHRVFEFAPTPLFTLLFFISCSLAVGVNFSGFLLIRVTSAVTYMVVGHVKTLLIISSAFMLFRSPMAATNIACILVAFSGVVTGIAKPAG